MDSIYKILCHANTDFPHVTVIFMINYAIYCIHMFSQSDNGQRIRYKFCTKPKNVCYWRTTPQKTTKGGNHNNVNNFILLLR